MTMPEMSAELQTHIEELQKLEKGIKTNAAMFCVSPRGYIYIYIYIYVCVCVYHCRTFLAPYNTTLHITHYTLHITHYTLHITHYTAHILADLLDCCCCIRRSSQWLYFYWHQSEGIRPPLTRVDPVYWNYRIIELPQ